MHSFASLGSALIASVILRGTLAQNVEVTSILADGSCEIITKQIVTVTGTGGEYTSTLDQPIGTAIVVTPTSADADDDACEVDTAVVESGFPTVTAIEIPSTAMSAAALSSEVSPITTGDEEGCEEETSALAAIVTTVTDTLTAFTTFCPAATEITTNGKTYTATVATTLTITDCPCTVTSVQTLSAVQYSVASVELSGSSAPAQSEVTITATSLLPSAAQSENVVPAQSQVPVPAQTQSPSSAAAQSQAPSSASSVFYGENPAVTVYPFDTATAASQAPQYAAPGAIVPAPGSSGSIPSVLLVSGADSVESSAVAVASQALGADTTQPAALVSAAATGYGLQTVAAGSANDTILAASPTSSLLNMIATGAAAGPAAFGGFIGLVAGVAAFL